MKLFSAIIIGLVISTGSFANATSYKCVATDAYKGNPIGEFNLTPQMPFGTLNVQGFGAFICANGDMYKNQSIMACFFGNDTRRFPVSARRLPSGRRALMQFNPKLQKSVYLTGNFTSNGSPLTMMMFEETAGAILECNPF